MLKIQEKMLMPGKTALVCGASQGIGAAAAEALADLGCQVLLVARNKENLEAVRAQLSGSGHEVLPCDFSNESDFQNLLTNLKSRKIEILVNNSGGPKGGAILSAEPEEFLNGIKGHIVIAQKLIQVLVPQMQAAGYGRIVNVISTSVKAPLPNLGVSNTVRGAMASWAKTLAGEVGAMGITVNNLLPGYTETARLSQLRKGNADRLKQSEEDVSKTWINTIPARRFGEPWEQGAAIAFLCSPLASYINGINLPVDGGRTQSL